ncbi:MAG: hypothetical protein ACYTEL_08660 [Planctomycetota bacterium]|jgi:hypothetical protein
MLVRILSLLALAAGAAGIFIAFVSLSVAPNYSAIAVLGASAFIVGASLIAMAIAQPQKPK